MAKKALRLELSASDVEQLKRLAGRSWNGEAGGVALSSGVGRIGWQPGPGWTWRSRQLIK